jgi:uncharacterized protein YdhG (YjbR/CyaY superfamily)
MRKPTRAVETIDDYIRSAPAEVRPKLEKIRSIVRSAAPGAQEKISYRMPTFTLNGNLVHFAAFTKHIGFFPTGVALEKDIPEVAAYRASRGTLHFSLDEPLPVALIRRIVSLRVAQNRARVSGKGPRKPASRAGRGAPRAPIVSPAGRS